jgi:hypothetical protein
MACHEQSPINSPASQMPKTPPEGTATVSEDVGDSRPLKVVIHPWVDLDAAACVALTGVSIDQVYFLPANAEQLPSDLRDARVLDHPLGHKGELEGGEIQHAAAASLPEAADLQESDFLLEVEEQDTLGFAHPRFSLARILASLRAYYRGQGLEGEELDRAILRIMVPMLQALIYTERQNRNQRQAVLPQVEVGPYRFVVRIGRGEEGPVLLRNHAGMIYQDGFNLGVVRHPRRKEIDFRLLREELPGWFIHPSGFMACWGSFKAPANGPPPPGTPRTVAELVELLRKYFATPMFEETPAGEPPSGTGPERP